MFAANFSEANRVELIDIPEPELPPRPDSGPCQIKFQPELACLCGSDTPLFDRTDLWWPIEVGHSLHEMIGSVVETNGDRYKPGDRVLVVPERQIGFFERYVVDETRAVPLDPRPLEEQAMLAQPLGTVLFALKKLPNLLDLDVAIIGQGPIGQLYNAAVRNMGARNIIGIDLLDSRLELSAEMGANVTINGSQEDVVQAVSNATDGEMADIVIEAVGHKNHQLNQCITLCKDFGRILYFGVPPETIDGIRWRDLLCKNITIHTSINPSFERDFPLAMRWIAEKRVDLSKLITHRFPVEEIQTAFETFRDRVDGAQKVMLEFPAYQQN